MKPAFAAFFLTFVSLFFLLNCGNEPDDSSGRQAVPSENTSTSSAQAGQIIPSYNSHLDTVFMHAVPDIKIQEPLLQSLPDDTQVFLLVPDYKEKDTQKALKDMDVDRRNITPLVYNENAMWRGLWAQDIFEVLATDTEREIVLPDFFIFEDYYLWYPAEFEPTQETVVFSAYLKKKGYAVDILNGYIEGGNITSDRFNDRDILMVGADNLIDKEYFREYHFLLDDGIRMSKDSFFLHDKKREETIREFGKTFGADTVLVLGDRQYRTHMFHLDQSFLLIGPGEAVVMDLSHLTDQDIDEIAADFAANFSYMREKREEWWKSGLLSDEENVFLEKFSELADKNEVHFILHRSREMLEEIHSALKEQGYTIHRFRQDPYQNLYYQSYANSIVYTDRKTDRKTVLLPIFPGTEGVYDREDELNRAAIHFFETLGLEVIPVINYTWAAGGNNNCLINIFR
ncbi:MAG: hypothetical protein MUP70_13500 [Candidatus Aminicenantes bacterium]|nr:hypothetical protein [Candidatus Aminicenantes bacterium]